MANKAELPHELCHFSYRKALCKSYFNPLMRGGFYRVRQKDLPYFKRQLQTNKERYRKNTFICEQKIRCHFTLLGFKNYVL
jgi:hypothetical protein